MRAIKIVPILGQTEISQQKYYEKSTQEVILHQILAQYNSPFIGFYFFVFVLIVFVLIVLF
jgi:hypothetical protein